MNRAAHAHLTATSELEFARALVAADDLAKVRAGDDWAAAVLAAVLQAAAAAEVLKWRECLAYLAALPTEAPTELEPAVLEVRTTETAPVLDLDAFRRRTT